MALFVGGDKSSAEQLIIDLSYFVSKNGERYGDLHRLTHSPNWFYMTYQKVKKVFLEKGGNYDELLTKHEVNNAI